MDVSASKGVFGHCISKLKKIVNVYMSGNAKSYLSLKFSIIKIKYVWIDDAVKILTT